MTVTSDIKTTLAVIELTFDMIGETVYNLRNKVNKYRAKSVNGTAVVEHDNPTDDYTDINIIRNVQYYSGSNYVPHKHCYDIYYKPAAEGQKVSVPIIFSIHGGGYQRGDKSSNWRGSPVIGRVLARHNYIVVAVNYRLSPHAKLAIFLRSFVLPLLLYPVLFKLITSFSSYYIRFTLALSILQYVYFWIYDYNNRVTHPAFFDDSVAAFKHMIDNIQTLVPHADVNRIYMHGHSAGAHMASLLANDQTYIQSANVDTKRIRGVVAVSGIFSVRSPIKTFWGDMGWIVFYASSAFGLNKAVYDAVSPINHVKQSSPPHLLISAESDMGLENDSKAMYEKLQQFGITSYHYTVLGTSHSTVASLLDKHSAHKHIITFLQQCEGEAEAEATKQSATIK